MNDAARPGLGLAGGTIRQVRFASGDLEVTVLPEIGARLHSLRAFGHELLRSPSDLDAHRSDPFLWGGYVMAPWCNRIEAGRVNIGDRTIDLAPNSGDGSATHGQVYDRPWQDRGDGSFEVSGGGDGWPWTYVVRLRVEVVGCVLRLDLSVRNTAPDPMPAGIGLHPWFRRPVQVAIHAEEVYRSNAATTARPELVSGSHDLRVLADMPEGLDATWTSRGDQPVELGWPDAGLRAELRTTPEAFIVAASPPGIGAIAVEPETHAPQGLRRLRNGEPGALTWLAPGGELRLITEMTFQRCAATRPQARPTRDRRR